MITTGALAGQPSSSQSNATCPPSLNFKISLEQNYRKMKTKVLLFAVEY
jgi:hypothetical protein